MRSVLTGGLLSAFVAFGIVASANAEVVVKRSGDTYYTEACGPVVGRVARCHAQNVTDSKGKPLVSLVPPISGFTPANLRDAYKVTATGSPSTLIAIVDAFGYDNAESELGVYRAQFGLPPCTTANGCFKKLNQKGQEKNYPAQDNGWATESALDLDMASAMCPNCKIYLIEAKTNSFKNLGESVDLAASLGAHVISNSYGGAEGGYAPRFEHYYDHPGIAVTASTGDVGYGVQAPADMPVVISVGGTNLQTKSDSDRGWTEQVWRGAGSGCSKQFAKPEWQTDKGCKGRMVADTSAVADPASPVAIYVLGGWHTEGGTSVAAPLIGGIFGANGGVVSSASTLYEHSSAFFDVTLGSNGTCSTREKKAYFCHGEVGYDGPTGLGTPNGITGFGD
jgi:subtilase family serine protease